MGRQATEAMLDADPQMFEVWCQRMVGEGLPEDIELDELEAPHDICRSMGLTYGGLVQWVNRTTENAEADAERQRKFWAAHEVRTFVMAEDAIAIADKVKDSRYSVHVSAARLRGDRRMQMAEAFNRKTFGQKVQVAHTLPVLNITVAVQNAPERVVHEQPPQLPIGTPAEMEI